MKPNKPTIKSIKNKVNSLNNFFKDLGVITFLCGSSSYHREFNSAHIMAYMVPSLKANQYKIYYKSIKPFGAVTWAFLSDKISKKYETGDYVLQMKDFNSGDNVWITEFITPYDEISNNDQDRKIIIENLKSEIFIDKKVKVLIRNSDGSLKNIFEASGNNYKK